VAVNIGGIGPAELRFTGPVLADVFLGKISRWSDPAIKALNPTLSLPEAQIVVMYRSDGSGSTFNFANYLSKISPEWKAQLGAAMLLRWPTGTPAKGNEGVAQEVKRVKNSIGYVEFAQALEAKLSYAVIQNRAGRFIRPDPASFQAAAASADWRSTRDFHLLLTDAPGEQAYPITATVFVFMHKSASRARIGAALDFFRWSLEKGSSTAARLGYVPLPAFLIDQVKDYWARTFNFRT
jgi:phosphate transport system substrate-binding protein